MNVFFIALGSNLPFGGKPPSSVLQSALKSLAETSVSVDAVSRFYGTPCFPKDAGPDYVNAAARVVSSDTPAAMLEKLHTIETEFGRTRDTRWGLRTLDLDLIAAGQQVVPDRATFEKWRNLPMAEQMQVAPDELILPHPRLQDRAFVLVPLRDVAADWVHPVLNRTVADMCDALSPEVLAEIVAL